MTSTPPPSSNGAAEEPKPEPGGSLSSTTTASYDPTIYQRPHPNDRGGGGGDGSKPSKKKGEADKRKSKSKSTGKGALSLDFCGNCGAEGDLRKCKQCGAVAYCGEACQRVSAAAELDQSARLCTAHRPRTRRQLVL